MSQIVGFSFLHTSSDLKKYNGVPTPPGYIQIYGHRGARADYPEHSIEGYTHALLSGVSYLDADILMSREGELIATHNLALDPNTTRDSSGKFISPIDPPAIHCLSVAELKKYDIGMIKPGSDYAKLFPHQQVIAAQILTLEEMIDFVISKVGDRVGFQIEIKSGPPIQKMAKKLASLLHKKGVIDRTEVQSFDWAYLIEIQKIDPSIKTAYLTMPSTPIDLNSIVGHGGAVFGPFEMDVTKQLVEKAHILGLKVVPWGWPEKEGTAFNEPCIRRLIEWDVDGIITDVPKALFLLLSEQELSRKLPSQQDD